MLRRLLIVALVMALGALGAVAAADQHREYLPVVYTAAALPTLTPTGPPIPTETLGPQTGTPSPTP